MSTTDYIPAADTDKAAWLQNAAAKLPVYQTVLSLAATDLAQVNKDSDMFAYTLNMQNLVKQTQQNVTAFKNLLKHQSDGQTLDAVPAMPVFPAPPAMVDAGIFDRVRSLVQRIKNSPGYTDAIGQDLDVISPVNSIDLNAISPVLKATLDVGRPHLRWPKGVAEAADLYADHNDGSGFVLLGRFMRGEYLDLTPIPTAKIAEEYKYKAIYVIGDTQVGVMSQVFAITALRA